MEYTITTTDQYHEVLFDFGSYRALQQFSKHLSPEQLEQEIQLFLQAFTGTV